MWVVLLLIIVGISPGFTFVVLEQEASLCRSEEFSCNDGECISLNKYCDGQRDCFNGADEDCGVSLLLQDDVTLSRFKRQTSKCRGQFQCRDGSCVGLETKCDGIVDCPDGSDETFALCRKTPCQEEWFRCNYGACVDGGAPCNGYKECADNSDELLPRCRNETDGQRGQFRCGDGQIISVAKSCDGVKDCKDGTDETLRTCAGVKCPSYLFQCAYGACIDEGSDCNNITECADGSDESDELCKPNAVPLITTTSTTTAATIQTGNCVLPPYPAHGRYTVAGDPKLGPGNSLPSVYLNLTCNAGYGVEDQKTTVYCYDGYWSADPFPKCVRLCRLNPHPSVEYQCLISGSNGIEGTRPCSLFEPVGTSVRPVCKKPNYYYSGVLSLMRCSEGGWNYVATCLPGSQNTKDISIIINDTIEIHITKLQNSNNDNSATNNDNNSNNDIAILHINQSHVNINIPINGEKTNKIIINNNGQINDAFTFPNDYNKVISNNNKPSDVPNYNNSNIDEIYWRMGSEQPNNDIRK